MGLVLADAVAAASLHFGFNDTERRPKFDRSIGNEKSLDGFYYTEMVFTVLFDLEALFKIWCLGWKAYWSRSLFKFEFILCIGSTLHILPIFYQTEFTYLAVLRIVRLIKASPMLEDFCFKIFGPGKKLGSLILFTTCLLVITSSFSLQLFCAFRNFGQFSTFFTAFMSMFQILTQKGWVAVMHETIDAASEMSTGSYFNMVLVPAVAIYFLFYHLFVTLIVLSLFVAVILDNLELEEDIKKLKQLKLREMSAETQQKLPMRLRIFEKFPNRPQMIKMTRLVSDFLLPKVRDSFMRQFAAIAAMEEVEEEAVKEIIAATIRADAHLTTAFMVMGTTNNIKTRSSSQKKTAAALTAETNAALAAAKEIKRKVHGLHGEDKIQAIIFILNESTKTRMLNAEQLQPSGGRSLLSTQHQIRLDRRSIRNRGGLSANAAKTRATTGTVLGGANTDSASSRHGDRSTGHVDIKVLQQKAQLAEMKRTQQEEDLRENHPFFDKPLFALGRESKFRHFCRILVEARYKFGNVNDSADNEGTIHSDGPVQVSWSREKRVLKPKVSARADRDQDTWTGASLKLPIDRGQSWYIIVLQTAWVTVLKQIDVPGRLPKQSGVQSWYVYMFLMDVPELSYLPFGARLAGLIKLSALLNLTNRASRRRSLGRKKIRYIAHFKFSKLFGMVTYLDWIMILVTLVSCASMANETPEKRLMNTPNLQIAEHVFFVTMTLELMLKVLARGLVFTPEAVLKDFGGFLDLFIYVITLAFVSHLMWIDEVASGSARQMMMLMRCMRPLRIFTLMPPMRRVVYELVRGFREILMVSVLLVVFMFIFAVYGVHLFGGRLAVCNDRDIKSKYNCTGTFQRRIVVTKLKGLPGSEPKILVPRVWASPRNFNFDNIGNAMLALFEILSLEGWVEIRDIIRERIGATHVVYIHLFVFIGCLIGLTLFVGVVIANYSENKGTALLTVDQRRWLDLKGRIKLTQPLHIPPRPKLHQEGALIKRSTWEMRIVKIRCYAYDITQKLIFKRAVALVVLLNCCLLFFPFNKNCLPNEWRCKMQLYLAIIFTLFFTVECTLKIMALNFKGYWQSRRNRFDLVITVLGLVWVSVHSHIKTE
ncbi:hypothetical protein Ciccas_012363, partial [Cichlidogyrus casuarinus]